jgi:hypothetical protein
MGEGLDIYTEIRSRKAGPFQHYGGHSLHISEFWDLAADAEVTIGMSPHRHQEETAKHTLPACCL